MLAPSYRRFCRLLLLSILLLLVQPFFGLAAETIRSDGRLPITAELSSPKSRPSPKPPNWTRRARTGCLICTARD